MKNFENLTEVQSQAVCLLASGESITETAAQLKLSRKTVSSWINGSAEFKAALQNCQTEMFNEEILRLRGLASRALDVISQGLDHQDFRIRLSAANKVLSLSQAVIKPKPLAPPVSEVITSYPNDEEIAEIFAKFDL